MESKTPKTDQYVKMRASLGYCVEKDTAGFARSIERDLNEIKTERDIFASALEQIASGDKDHDGCAHIAYNALYLKK